MLPLATCELLIQPHWAASGPLLFALISPGAASVAYFWRARCWAATRAGTSIRPATGSTVTGAPLGIHVHEWESRAQSYTLELRLDDGLVLRMGAVRSARRSMRICSGCAAGSDVPGHWMATDPLMPPCPALR